MMKKYIVIIGCLFYSCTQPALYKLAAYRTDKPDYREYYYQDGDDIIVSRLNNSTVVITGGKRNANEIHFLLLIANTSDKPINFYPELVKVFAKQNNGTDWVELHIYSPSEYSKLLDKRYSKNTALMAFATGMASYNSGKSKTTSSSYTLGDLTDDEGNTLSMSALTTTTSETIDYSKQAETNKRSIDYNTRLKELYNSLKEGQLKKNTVFPDLTIEGKVIVGINSLAEKGYIVEIPLEGEIHDFGFVPDLK